MEKNKIINLATLFSGIGAIEQAFKQTKINHNIIFACDNDKFVKESYLANYFVNNWYDDILNFNSKKYRYKIDLLVGGSPCQSFSIAGYRKGLEDLRGILIFEFIRIIKESKPKVFIFENVKGLINHDKGKTWEIIKKEFDKLGYHLTFSILNSKDYGVPQSRPRLFLVGFRSRTYFLKFEFPKPFKLESFMSDYLDKEFSESMSLSKKAFLNISNKERLRKKYTQINGDVALCQNRNQQMNLRGDFVTKSYLENFILSEKLKKTVMKYGKTDNKIAKTILATNYKFHYANRDNYISIDEDKIRRLTPRECLRLMGFSEDFKIVVSKTQIYKQSGNSIVVDVLKLILKQIIKTNVFK